MQLISATSYTFIFALFLNLFEIAWVSFSLHTCTGLTTNTIAPLRESDELQASMLF